MSNVEKNSYLVKKLESGEWIAFDVGSKTADELNPEASAAIKENIAARTQQKISVKESTLYKCAKCGGKQTTQPTGKQNRSLDEGQAMFVTCLNEQCRNKFQVR